MEILWQMIDLSMIGLFLQLAAHQQPTVIEKADIALIEEIIMIAAQQQAVVVVDRFIEMRTVTEWLDMRGDQHMRQMDVADRAAMIELMKERILVKGLQLSGFFPVVGDAPPWQQLQDLIEIRIMDDRPIGVFPVRMRGRIDRFQIITEDRRRHQRRMYALVFFCDASAVR